MNKTIKLIISILIIGSIITLAGLLLYSRIISYNKINRLAKTYVSEVTDSQFEAFQQEFASLNEYELQKFYETVFKNEYIDRATFKQDMEEINTVLKASKQYFNIPFNKLSIEQQRELFDRLEGKTQSLSGTNESLETGKQSNSNLITLDEFSYTSQPNISTQKINPPSDDSVRTSIKNIHDGNLSTIKAYQFTFTNEKPDQEYININGTSEEGRIIYLVPNKNNLQLSELMSYFTGDTGEPYPITTSDKRILIAGTCDSGGGEPFGCSSIQSKIMPTIKLK